MSKLFKLPKLPKLSKLVIVSLIILILIVLIMIYYNNPLVKEGFAMLSNSILFSNPADQNARFYGYITFKRMYTRYRSSEIIINFDSYYGPTSDQHYYFGSYNGYRAYDDHNATVADQPTIELKEYRGGYINSQEGLSANSFLNVDGNIYVNDFNAVVGPLN